MIYIYTYMYIYIHMYIYIYKRGQSCGSNNFDVSMDLANHFEGAKCNHHISLYKHLRNQTYYWAKPLKDGLE